MGHILSKKTPMDDLQKFFKREIEGKDKCKFTGALNAYDKETLNKFDEWLVSKGYDVIHGEDFVNGLFTYEIVKKNKNN